MLYARLLLGISTIALASSVATAQTNTTQNSQTGVGNVATVDNTAPGNIGNSSTIVQNGNYNSATVFQRESFNISYIQQAGTSNEGVHQQSGNSNSADTRENGDFLKSAVAQVGNSNKATVAQVGGYNISTVRQGFAIDSATPAGEFRPANGNSATVDQNGYGISSEIGQRGASAGAPAASQNTAFVYQRSAGFTTSLQQQSRIIQESRGNTAEVFQYEGSTDAPNSSTITQRHSAATADSGAASNRASVAQEGTGQTSSVLQDGLRSTATVRMQGGGVGTDANQVSISQTGNDLNVSYRLRPRAPGGAVGNQATAQQTGTRHTADIYQFGSADRATVTQADGVDTGAYATGETARGEVFLSQNTRGGAAAIRQTGDNFADVTQAFGSASTTDISQIDAGDVAGARTRNTAIASQYGTANTSNIAQNALGAAATSWQKVGSASNVLTVGQGTGGTGLVSTTGVSGFGPGAQGSGSSQLSADIIQAGTRNEATVYQDGTRLTAAVGQDGSGSSAYKNIVFVSQTGGTNSAIAYQGSGVGPSSAGDPQSGNSSADNGGAAADEFFFAGGARSAEIAILQTSAGNRASVYQYGRGQIGRIEQSGNNNVAGIIQELNATNATAVIRQNGDNNSYYIQQVTAGQYVVVSQTGSNNVSSNVQRGAPGGSSGFTPPPGYPGF